jgi:hypothetical protein
MEDKEHLRKAARETRESAASAARQLEDMARRGEVDPAACIELADMLIEAAQDLRGTAREYDRRR